MAAWKRTSSRAFGLVGAEDNESLEMWSSGGTDLSSQDHVLDPVGFSKGVKLGDIICGVVVARERKSGSLG